MAGFGERVVRQQQRIGPFLAGAVVLGLIGLPTAVGLELRDLSERLLKDQASEIGRIIDEMRGFCASDVVGRVLQATSRSLQRTTTLRFLVPFQYRQLCPSRLASALALPTGP